jgi:hypothetical protein
MLFKKSQKSIEKSLRPWFKKKRWIIVLTFVVYSAYQKWVPSDVSINDLTDIFGS